MSDAGPLFKNRGFGEFVSEHLESPLADERGRASDHLECGAIHRRFAALPLFFSAVLAEALATEFLW